MAFETTRRVHAFTRAPALLLGTGVVAVGISLGCQRPASPVARCATQDVFASAAAYLATNPQAEQDMRWLHRAQVCDLGSYLVTMSTDADASAVFVLRKGTPNQPIFL